MCWMCGNGLLAGRRRLLAMALACWAVAGIVLCAGIAYAGDRVKTEVLCVSQTVGAGTAEVLGSLISLGNAQLNGYFTLYVEVTGDGTAKFEYVLSWDGTNSIEPVGAADIATGYTKTSGEGGDGKDAVPVYPMRAPYIGIRCTETGGVSDVVITARLSYH
jgi:hypothetical protein